MSAVLTRTTGAGPSPDPWNDHAIDPYRACTRCRCSRETPDGVRHCTSPNVTLGRGFVTLQAARQQYGACGPDAEHAEGLW
jgi:hypothetical protein